MQVNIAKNIMQEYVLLIKLALLNLTRMITSNNRKWKLFKIISQNIKTCIVKNRDRRNRIKNDSTRRRKGRKKEW